MMYDGIEDPRGDTLLGEDASLLSLLHQLPQLAQTAAGEAVFGSRAVGVARRTGLQSTAGVGC